MMKTLVEVELFSENGKWGYRVKERSEGGKWALTIKPKDNRYDRDTAVRSALNYCAALDFLPSNI